MPRKANKSVGTCPCPVKDCSADKAPLFRFANRSTTPDRARKAGKFYGRCPAHGWFGYDAAPATQAYIREHGKLNQGEKWETVDSNAAKPPVSSTTEPAKETPAPSKPPKPKRPDVWDL